MASDSPGAHGLATRTNHPPLPHTWPRRDLLSASTPSKRSRSPLTSLPSLSTSRLDPANRTRRSSASRPLRSASDSSWGIRTGIGTCSSLGLQGNEPIRRRWRSESAPDSPQPHAPSTRRPSPQPSSKPRLSPPASPVAEAGQAQKVKHTESIQDKNRADSGQNHSSEARWVRQALLSSPGTQRTS